MKNFRNFVFNLFILQQTEVIFLMYGHVYGNMLILSQFECALGYFIFLFFTIGTFIILLLYI